MLPRPLTPPPKNTFVTEGRPPFAFSSLSPHQTPPLRLICHLPLWGDFIGQHKQQHCAAAKCHRCGKCYVNDPARRTVIPSAGASFATFSLRRSLQRRHRNLCIAPLFYWRGIVSFSFNLWCGQMDVSNYQPSSAL